MDSILFAAKVYLIGTIISFAVAGLIKLIYMAIRRGNKPTASGVN
jgi:hypothetical protein